MENKFILYYISFNYIIYYNIFDNIFNHSNFLNLKKKKRGLLLFI